MTISKWGNSLAIRLPQAVVTALELREGDSVEIHVVGERTFEMEKTPSALQLIARLRKHRGSLPPDFHFERAEAGGRE